MCDSKMTPARVLNPSRTPQPFPDICPETAPISRKAKIIGGNIRLEVDLPFDQVSDKNSLMVVSDRQMSGKG